MTWTAIVPIKPAHARKTRLPDLDAAQRDRLTERMLGHVLGVLRDHPDVARVVVLAAEGRDDFETIVDRGRGLNAELEAARSALDADLLVIHADLPAVDADEVSALLAAAQLQGAAIAPDRHGSGTNAVCLRRGMPFAFRFGPGSRDRHAMQLGGAGAIVERPGLGLDIDTADDLALAADLEKTG